MRNGPTMLVPGSYTHTRSPGAGNQGEILKCFSVGTPIKNQAIPNFTPVRNGPPSNYSRGNQILSGPQ